MLESSNAALPALMNDLLLVLTPILLTDVANPVLFALLVYLAGSRRGVLLCAVALSGHTLAYFASGIGIALVFEQVMDFIENPGPVSYGIGAALGVLLVWVGWLSRTAGEAAEPAPANPDSAVSAFTTGAIINFIGIPFALPYFAAIDQILRTTTEASTAVFWLAGYNLAYLTPFLVVPILTAVLGDRARPILSAVNQRVEAVAGFVMPFILAGVGLVLIVDAALYFATGTGLF
jgi:cytochrome c biogenesis protein CcdA